MTNFLLIFTLFQQTLQLDSIPLIDGTQILVDSYRLLSEEKYDSAITQLIKVHPEDSNFNLVGHQLISSFAKRGQLSKADSMAALLKERGPLSVSFYLQYGNAYINAEEFDKAIGIYNEGLESFPFNHSLTYNIGFAKSRQEKYEEAMRYFQEVLMVSPFYSSAHQMLANICASLGFRTKALLSYATYLAINPDKNWALVRMNSLVNDSYRAEGSFNSAGLDNSEFEYYDNLSKSRAAMDDRFRSEVSFEAPVAQQFELLLKKLVMREGSDDFWMNYYVPAFVKMEEKGLSADFIYYLLTSTNDDDVTTYLKKNFKSKDEWIDIFNTSFIENRLNHERTLSGETAIYQHWYRDDNTLTAIGNKTGEKNTGPWVYYHENGRKNAEGTYADQGDKIGTWYYYHNNGKLSSEEFHDEAGLVQGEIKRYSREGILTGITSYKDDDLHGNWQGFFTCGQVSERYPYNEGEGIGEGEAFYESGEVKAKYTVKNSMLDGEYTYFHLNGSVSYQYNYVEDKKEGPYAAYHNNGQISEKGMYSNDLATGLWENYFSNGVLRSKGNYLEGEKTGEWNYYYGDGLIQTKENYKDGGLLEGNSYLYDRAGKKYGERTYSDGVLVAYKFWDQKGKILYEQSDLSGNYEDYRYYYPNGTLKSKGSAEAGVLEGSFETYHVNGKLYQKGTMKNGGWEGIYREYDESGSLIFAYTNTDGEADGYFRQFYENGQVKEEGWILDGQAQQLWREYWMDGTIKIESYFVDGNLEGLFRQYGPKGKLYEERLFRNNEPQQTIQYDTTGVVFHVLDINDADEPAVTKYPDGSNYFSSGYTCGKLSDNITFYYPDGSVLSSYEIKHTQYSGSYRSYDLLRRLTGKGSYENDMQEKEWTFYHDNGEVDSKFNYRDDKRHGAAHEYYENGVLKMETNYMEGDQHGKRIQYGPSGEVMLIKYYTKDIGPTAYQYYQKDGSLSDTIPIPVSGQFELKSYYPNGNVSAIQQYHDYYFEGNLIYYDEEGNIMRKTPFKEGEMQGESTYYYPDGKVKKVFPNYYGEEHGEVRRYHKNGQLKESSEYLFGVQNGWMRIYSEEGKLLKEVYYWNDRIYGK
ncbi:MAG: hypothetical protein RIM99_19670 [Cyclobacteriaceae bacterium]